MQKKRSEDGQGGLCLISFCSFVTLVVIPIHRLIYLSFSPLSCSSLDLRILLHSNITSLTTFYDAVAMIKKKLIVSWASFERISVSVSVFTRVYSSGKRHIPWQNAIQLRI